MFVACAENLCRPSSKLARALLAQRLKTSTSVLSSSASQFVPNNCICMLKHFTAVQVHIPVVPMNQHSLSICNMIKNGQLNAQLDETHSAHNGLALAQVSDKFKISKRINARLRIRIKKDGKSRGI